MAQRRLHLDPVGGIAGDMFVAAMLDARPDLADGTLEAIRAAGLPQSVGLEVVSHKDHALTGTRFVVKEPDGEEADDHVHFKSLRARLEDSDLGVETRDRAIDIFDRLAVAECKIHGVDKEDVTFHEVGAWDSIADVVGAAHLIEQAGAARWSVASVPVGAGRVKSAHGMLPLPAPAVTELLEGFIVHDDGLRGERVTPTGAAILCHLEPDIGGRHAPARLTRSGTGFGTRTFPGISNVLRVLEFDALDLPLAEDEVALLRFEVDDQAPEDLAVGLDRLRAMTGVIDVLQSPAFGKKGRMTVQVQVLARPDALEAVMAGCFTETTTLGVRWELARRAILERGRSTHRADGDSINVKFARRPAGTVTAKAEIDDVAGLDGGHAARIRRRHAAEDAVLKDRSDDD
jgi:uncharacterized protein (TIGR00299 family) protein